MSHRQKAQLPTRQLVQTQGYDSNGIFLQKEDHTDGLAIWVTWSETDRDAVDPTDSCYGSKASQNILAVVWIHQEECPRIKAENCEKLVMDYQKHFADVIVESDKHNKYYVLFYWLTYPSVITFHSQDC